MLPQHASQKSSSVSSLVWPAPCLVGRPTRWEKETRQAAQAARERTCSARQTVFLLWENLECVSWILHRRNNSQLKHKPTASTVGSNLSFVLSLPDLAPERGVQSRSIDSGWAVLVFFVGVHPTGSLATRGSTSGTTLTPRVATGPAGSLLSTVTRLSGMGFHKA